MKTTSIAVLLGIALWTAAGAGIAADSAQPATEVREAKPVGSNGHARDKAIDGTELSNKSKVNVDTPAHVDQGAGDKDYAADVKRCGAIAGTDKVLCIVPANRNRDQM